MLFLLSLGFCLNIIVLELIRYSGKVENGVLLIWVLILKSWLKLLTMICLRKCVTVFTACHLSFPHVTLLITGLISDHVVTTCYFLPSKRFCLKLASLCEFSISTIIVCFTLNMLVVDIYWLSKTHCLWHFIVWLLTYFVCSMFVCNPVRLSQESVKGNLLTYLIH